MSRGLKTILIIFFGLIAFVAYLVIFVPPPHFAGEKQAEAPAPAPDPPPPPEPKDCSDTTLAFIMSQHFVEARLKAPATADFPSSGDSRVTVTYLGNCVHEVIAFVDAQNAFGANIRTRYYAKVQNQKGTDKWTALAVELIE